MSLYTENPDRYLELLKYKVQISDQIFCKNRKKDFSVINNLINGKPTTEDFIDEFLCLWEKYRDTSHIGYDPSITSKGFSKCMDKLFCCFKSIKKLINKLKVW